jgi:pimeloyl-ACP methyl ester carboxylesterase
VSSAPASTATELIDGVKVDVVRAGVGKTLLFLHSVDGVDPSAEWFAALAESFNVVAPWHPGFGHSEWPREFRSIGDLAFFYLELIRELEIEDAVLIGASFGGWLAAEIAIRSVGAFSHVVFVDPLGIKIGGREDRDIADVFSISQQEVARLVYHDPARGMRDYSTMSDAELLAIARSREAYTYYGWKPYMHNPSLRRWLRRIRVPTLVVWGQSDGFVSPEYGRAFAAEIAGARFEVIDEAGHYPHLEQPEAFTALVRSFVNDGTPVGSLAGVASDPEA